VARIVRPMLKDVDGLPLVGTTGKCLGVRPIGPHADVDLNPAGDVNGEVVSNDKGLSVGDDWRKLPGYLIPEHLDDGFNRARGKNMAVYVHGNGTGPNGIKLSGIQAREPAAPSKGEQENPGNQATRLAWRCGLAALAP
jgi:hypothetical protein